MDKGDRVVVEYKRKFFKKKDPAKIKKLLKCSEKSMVCLDEKRGK